MVLNMNTFLKVAHYRQHNQAHRHVAKFKHVRNIGYKTYIKLYDCGVSPILDYAGEVCGKSLCNKIQNRAIRVFLGVNSFSSNAGVQGDMGWPGGWAVSVSTST